MKKIILLFAGSIVICNYVSSQKTLTLTKQTWPAVTVDGVMDSKDAWKTSNWQDITLPVAAGNSTSSMSAKFQIAYDDACLYFLGQSNDNTPNDTLNAASNTHINDCFEVFVGLDTSDYANSGAYKLGDYQFRFTGWVDNTSFPARFDVGTGNPSPTGALTKTDFTNDPWMKIAGSNDGSSEFIEEWSIPWRVLRKNMDPSWDTKQLKFEVQAADATPSGTSQTRTQQMFWGKNTDQQWQNTMDFGGLITLTTKVDTTFTVINTAHLNSVSAYQDGKMLFLNGMSQVVSAYDLMGRVVLQTRNNSGKIDVSGLSKGIYYFKDNRNNGIKVFIQ